MSNLLVANQLKTCSKCMKSMPFSCFGVRKNSADGFNGRCKHCVQVAVDSWKAKNRIRYLCSMMLANAKRRAKAKNRECTINLEYVLSLYTEQCPVLGIALRWSCEPSSRPESVAPNSPTLDRIDNNFGYIPGNLAIVSHKANSFKGDLSSQQLRQLINYANKGANQLPLDMINLTDSELEVLFRTWWQQSYPTPPGPHALMTHTAWARFLLDHLGQGQQREQER